MRCSPKEIIKTSQLKERLRFKNGETRDIITVIMDMDAVADRYVNAEAAQCLVGGNDYETLHNVWRFVKRNLTYRADKRGKEVVKSPAALFALGRGDCKSFSIAVVALLRALGFKGIRYRFTAYKGASDVTHVYVVCKLDGNDVILDAVHDYFDDEVAYSWKTDKRAASGIAGIGLAPGTGTAGRSSIMTFIALGLIAWGATR